MSNEDIARLLEAIKDWNGVARDEFASQIDDAVKSLRRPTKGAAELAKRFAQGVGIQTETSCKNCGHSKSRHQTVGGFCKHCTCNEFVESALPPIR
jgi:hypothetical protein